MFRSRTNNLMSAVSSFVMAGFILIGGPIIMGVNEPERIVESIFWSFLLSLVFVAIGFLNYMIYQREKENEEKLYQENEKLKKALRGFEDSNYKMKVGDDE